MARKKKSQKHQKEACEEDTSDEELKTYQSVKTCSHIPKAVNLARLKKALKTTGDVDKCKDCKEIRPQIVPDSTKEVGDEEIQVNEVWLCLQCGYRGCGRNSTEKHAVQHYKTPHSDCHAVVLGLSSTSVWCYACDNIVLNDSSRNLKDCFDFVMKQRNKVPNNIVMNGDKKSTKQVLPSETNEKVEKGSSYSKSKEIKEKENKKSAGTLKSSGTPSARSIKGLRNLGNTCFFNAVMQNLCQTPWLLSELEHQVEKGFEWELPYPVDEKIQNPEVPTKFILPNCHSLTEAFVNFLKQMNKPSSHLTLRNEALNPSSLFDQICKKSPQFCGFHQQDSHELLRQLLDGIRNEEIKRQKKAILNAFDIKSEEVDDKTKHIIKAYGNFASHTVVERIFGGQLLSTVVCEECKGSSQVFEPFMDLSLPLIEEKPMRTGKLQKHDDEDDSGLHYLPKKKENNSELSKHQEKKLKQLNKKQLRKVQKTKLNNNLPAKENNTLETVTKSNASDHEAQPNKEKENSPSQDANEKVCKNEISQTKEIASHNVPENSKSEKETPNIKGIKNVNKKAPSITSTEENGTNEKGDQESNEDLSDADVEDNDDEALAIYNENTCDTKNIEELCNQITELRIRRDSDKNEDLLIEEYRSNMKQRKSLLVTQSSNALEEEEEENEDDWAHSQSEVQAKEWILRSLTTLKARYQPTSKECSVNSCLNQFTASELLTGSNKFRCNNCTKVAREKTGKNTEVVYSNASKQLLIFSPPAILTLHLKRFQQTGMSLRKLNSFVQFPQILDLAPYCSSICLRLPHMSVVQDEVLYSLYGIVSHSGRLTSGHYTAYVKLQEQHANPAFLNNWPMGQYNLEQLLDKIAKVKPPNGLPYKSPENTSFRWYYVSDSMFKEVNQSEVMQCQAYILFYQRIK